MKKILFFISIIFLGQYLAAQSTAQQAKKWLDDASAQMKSYKDVSILFNYSFINDRVKPAIKKNESGDLMLKGQAYKLKFMGMEQISDGKMLYTILHEDEEVQKDPIDPNKPNGNALNPANILELYKKGFSYKLGGEEKLNGLAIVYIILKPNASEDLEYIQLGIVKTTKHLHSYEQKGRDGTITKFVVTSFKSNQNLPSNLFQFDPKKYPGYYIPK